MDELDLLQIPPMVELGAGRHSVNIAVTPHDDGAHVELRHPLPKGAPRVGGKTYRVMNQAVVADVAAAIRWIELVGASVGARLDAELRLEQRRRGYRA